MCSLHPSLFCYACGLRFFQEQMKSLIKVADLEEYSQYQIFLAVFVLLVCFATALLVPTSVGNPVPVQPEDHQGVFLPTMTFNI